MNGRDVQIDGVPLREYVEGLMTEQERGRETAASEREKAAAALRDAQSRAMEQAEREREKAAIAMREGLARSQKEGDDRLREHISNQVQQITAALESAEKLEVQRMVAAKEGTEAVRRELSLIVEASKQAVTKSEMAQKEVNEKSNEFRGQLADQAATLMPRKEAESRAGEQDRRIRLLEEQSARHGGGDEATRRSQDTSAWIAPAVIGLLTTVFVTLIVLIANGQI